MWHITIMCMFGLFIDINITLDDWHFTDHPTNPEVNAPRFTNVILKQGTIVVLAVLFISSNIALHKNANQMPGTYHDTFHHNGDPDTYLYYNANLAVGGNTNTNFLNKSCTSTSGNNYGPASCTVDLRQPYYVKGIRIYKRHNSRIRLQCFTVIGLGNSGNTTLYNDDDPSHQKHYEDEIIDIPLNPHHAYNSITIQIPARDRGFNGGEGAFLTLCEVQIFGRKGCQSTPSLASGYFNVVNGNINVGQRVTARCSAGYSLQGGSYITCTQDGHWSGSPQCIRITCGFPGSIENGFYSNLRGGGNRAYFNAHFAFYQLLYINCNDGYNYADTVTWRQCTGNGSWSGSEPICTRTTCQVPTTTTNIQFTYNKTRLLYNRIQYGETVIASCSNEQYKLTGSPSRVCVANGVFNGTAPLCVATCQRPVAAHGSFTNINSQFVKGQSISLVCNNGYETTSPNTKRVCQTDHSWSNGHIQCYPKRCNIQPIQNGSYNVTLAIIEFSEVVSFECKTGFKIIQGSKTRTCQANKSISGQNPVCKEIICLESTLSPDKNHYMFENGFTHPGRITYNEMIHITCKEGYERVTGSGTITCIDDDIFDKPELTCQVMKCQIPLPDHGFYLDTKTQFVVGESITLVCNDGYEVNSSNTTSICQINHSWSNSHIRCNPKRCIIRPVENGSYNVTSKYIDFQESISSECIKGFKPTTDNKTRTCQADESLSGTDPVCKEVLCSTNHLNPFENHYEFILEDLSISNRIKYNDSIRTGCKRSYGRVTGSETRTCIDVDIFDEPELMCTVIEASNEQQSSPLPIITGLACGCGLSIIIIIILVVVMLHKRRHLPNEQTTTEPYTSLDFTRSGESSTESNYSEISNTNMALHVL